MEESQSRDPPNCFVWPLNVNLHKNDVDPGAIYAKTDSTESICETLLIV